MFGPIRRALKLDPSLDTYDGQTVEVMRRVLRRRSVTVDVGAHTGLILKHLVRRAPGGRHFAFEPIPHCFQTLKEQFGHLRGVELFECALSAEPGSSSFQHVVSRPTYSGLKARRMDRPNEEIVPITVKCARLDDMIPADVKVDFVKIDVEGGELGVLQGGVATLRRSKPVVVFEHGLGGADYYGTEPEQVFDLLHGQAGLNVSLMLRFLKGSPPFTRAEFAENFRTGQNYYFIAYAG
jgi:FkbM family methyltransferase